MPGSRGFTKGDIDSLNIYTLATKDNLKFADGGSAAFSAPRTDANHPVFIRGYVAGYCHQNKRWYHVENLSKQVAAKASIPVRLTNYWVPDSMQAKPSPVFTATPGEENQEPRRKRTGATRLLETNTSNSLGD